jgi:16S rRNA (cytidine1402-2'-O)-methyltransferase
MPIGNPRDIGARALEAIRSADLILCEEWKSATGYFRAWGIENFRPRILLYNEHTTPAEEDEILARISSVAVTVLLSDAGMPVLCDPGHRLVPRARRLGVSIGAVPGPTALTSALALAGLGSEGFIFAGFPPQKSELRPPFLKAFASGRLPVVFYETPYRLKKLIGEIRSVIPGTKRIFIAVNISMDSEYIIDGMVKDITVSLSEKIPKGPPVIILYENG